jgi:hypothetical protein
MQSITSSHKILHVVHNTAHARKTKARPNIAFYRYYMHRGLPCTNKKLGSLLLGACGPQAPPGWPSRPTERCQ